MLFEEEGAKRVLDFAGKMGWIKEITLSAEGGKKS